MCSALSGSGIDLNVLVACKSRVLGRRKLNHRKGRNLTVSPSFVQCSYFRVSGGDGTRFSFPSSWLRRPRFKFGVFLQ